MGKHLLILSLGLFGFVGQTLAKGPALEGRYEASEPFVANRTIAVETAQMEFLQPGSSQAALSFI